jgi:hypothetical protein
MIDVTTARTVAARTRLPTLVLVLLLVVALLSALTAGYGMAKRKRRSVLHVVLYAAAVATTVYVVLDCSVALSAILEPCLGKGWLKQP